MMKALKWLLPIVAAMALAANGAWANRMGRDIAAPAPSHESGFKRDFGHDFGHEHHEWHRHHHRTIIIFAPAFLGPAYAPAYDDPMYSYPPPVYIEQGGGEGTTSGSPANFWYYCEATATYYPYVKECPGGWKIVPAQ